MEVEYYPSIRQRGKRSNRPRRIKQSSEQQKKRNEIESIRNCQRKILCNFCEGDYYITLTFAQGVDEEQCTREVKNFLQRLRRWKAKNGPDELKYIGCIERGGQRGRWHSHIVINRLHFDVLTAKWGKGMIDVQPLYADGNYKALAEYLRKNAKGRKRWFESRNLKKPKVTVRDCSKRELKKLFNGELPNCPKGYKQLYDECETRCNDITGTSLYLKYEKITT